MGDGKEVKWSRTFLEGVTDFYRRADTHGSTFHFSVEKCAGYCTEGNSYTHFSFTCGINYRLHLHRGRLEIIKNLTSYTACGFDPSDF